MKQILALVFVFACKHDAPAAPTTAPSATTGATASATASASADSFAALGLTDVGVDGGGRSEGFGNDGFGNGHNWRDHPPPKSKLRQGAVTVDGRLPPEVVQRIVRQNFGRFRLCYEEALAKSPTLAGTVSTKFVIDKHGAPTQVTREASTTLANATVVSCVTGAFSNLTFPEPEGGGVVAVTYPLIFSLPD
jgi:hypothetical protein